MLNIKVILPEKVSRLQNLSFVLGLLGMLALLFPSNYREDTGKQSISFNGVDLVGTPLPRIKSTHKRVIKVYFSKHLSDPDELKTLREMRFIQRSEVEVRSEPGDGKGDLIGKLYRYAPLNIDIEDEAAAGTGYIAISARTIEYNQDGSIADTDGIDGYVAAYQIGVQKSVQNGELLIQKGDLDISSIYNYNYLNIAFTPFKALAIFGLIWILYIFVLIMAPIYRLVAQIITLLNFIFAFITEKSNEDLARYLIRAEYFQWKILVSISGLSKQIPHIDIYATEKEKLPLQFASGFQANLSRNSIMVRLIVLGAYAFLINFVNMLALTKLGGIGYGFAMAAVLLPIIIIILFHIAYAVLQIIAWIAAGITGKPLASFIHFMFKIQKFLTTLNFLAMGLTDNPRLLLEAWSSRIVTEDEDDSDDTETQYDIIEYDPSTEAGVEINLLVLYLLVLCSGSIYTFCWMARVMKFMSDDSFTLLLLLLLSATIFSIYLIPEYYRRTEARRKQNGRPLIEFILMIPILNLFIGPFVIQYLLNRFEMLKRRQNP